VLIFDVEVSERRIFLPGRSAKVHAVETTAIRSGFELVRWNEKRGYETPRGSSKTMTTTPLRLGCLSGGTVTQRPLRTAQ
jgi:hypothetical protein